MDYKLSSTDTLTNQIKALDLNTWSELVQYVKSLPYGRNENRQDLSLVLKQQKGTCSSKHAFLKLVADFNQIPNIKLIIGLYKMSQENTPKIGSELSKNGMDYIPEAHCYLEINNQKVDITSNNSDFQKIEKDIIVEKEIQPKQVSDYKVAYHKSFLKQWIKDNTLDFSFDEIWTIREQCIENLTEKPK